MLGLQRMRDRKNQSTKKRYIIVNRIKIFSFRDSFFRECEMEKGEKGIEGKEKKEEVKNKEERKTNFELTKH